MKRVISLWLPRFASERRRPRPGSADRPAEDGALALYRAERGRLTVFAADARAEAAGIMPGLPLAEARALLPDLRALEYTPEADGETLRRLATWLSRYCPWTAVEHPLGQEGGGAGLWLDITGSAHLFGGEAALLEDLLARFAARGLTVHAGLADTPGLAWAAARFAARPDCAHCLGVGEGSGFLDALPPAALRLDDDRLELLARLGIRRIAELRALPPAAIARRFGPRVRRRLDQALGREAEAISPQIPVPAVSARRVFAEPVGRREDIAAALADLLEKLCRDLRARGEGARRLILTAHRVDGERQRLRLGASRPNRDPRHWQRLFEDRLERLDPGFGIEVLSLAVARGEALAAEQAGLGRTMEAARADAGPQALAVLVDRLIGRLGPSAVTMLQPRESHWPERAERRAPPFAKPGVARWAAGKARPLVLFDPPRPVAAIDALAEGPPRGFRWNRMKHRLARAAGAERIAPEWWHESFERAPGTRDYFAVEDEEGRRYWLFRQQDRWFLHGLFG